MFTSNFYKLLACANGTTNRYYNTSYGTLYDTRGDEVTSGGNVTIGSNSYVRFPVFGLPSNEYSSGSLYAISNGTYTFYGTSSTTPNDFGVMIGSGNTAPSLSDYNLTQQITDFTATTSISSAVNSDNKVEVTATYNITNTGSTEFTVREIGACAWQYYTGYSEQKILYEHSLLEQPVTIAAGATGVVTYKIVLG